MTPSILALAVIAVLAAIVVLFTRHVLHTEPLDLGVVSTRWLSDLRRDDPHIKA